MRRLLRPPLTLRCTPLGLGERLTNLDTPLGLGEWLTNLDELDPLALDLLLLLPLDLLQEAINTLTGATGE